MHAGLAISDKRLDSRRSMSSGECAAFMICCVGLPAFIAMIPGLIWGHYLFGFAMAFVMVVVFFLSCMSGGGRFVGDDSVKRMWGWMLVALLLGYAMYFSRLAQ